MARRSDHSREELIEIIMKVTFELLDEGGEKAVTARAVAGKIGYSPGTLYNLYEDINELLQYAHAQTLNMLDEILSEAVAKHTNDSPYNQILSLANTYAEFTRKYANRWQALLAHRIPDGAARPDWYRDSVEKCIRHVVQVLDGLLKQENLSDNSRLYAILMWASLHGLCSLTNDTTIEAVINVSPDEMIKKFVDMCLQGILET